MNFLRRELGILLCFISVSHGNVLLSAEKRLEKVPNILVIFADDLGYGDVSCYNPDRGNIPTPAIDRLAPERLTVAGLLKQQGYRTACIGKWHLGWEWPIEAGKKPLFTGSKKENVPATAEHQQAWRQTFSQPIPGGPTSHGFDRYFGTDVPNWPPFCYIDQDRTVGIPSEFIPARLFQNNQASQQGPTIADWSLEANSRSWLRRMGEGTRSVPGPALRSRTRPWRDKKPVRSTSRESRATHVVNGDTRRPWTKHSWTKNRKTISHSIGSDSWGEAGGVRRETGGEESRRESRRRLLSRQTKKEQPQRGDPKKPRVPLWPLGQMPSSPAAFYGGTQIFSNTNLR